MLYLGPNEATELKKSKIIFISLQVTVCWWAILKKTSISIVPTIVCVTIFEQKFQKPTVPIFKKKIALRD